MTPANHRRMTPLWADRRICRAALYSTPGTCRCIRCTPVPPASGDAGRTPDAAAAPESSPSPGGGTPNHFPGVADPAPGSSPAAARPSQPDHVELGRDTGGGLFGDTA